MPPVRRFLIGLAGRRTYLLAYSHPVAGSDRLGHRRGPARALCRPLAAGSPGRRWCRSRSCRSPHGSFIAGFAEPNPLSISVRSSAEPAVGTGRRHHPASHPLGLPAVGGEPYPAERRRGLGDPVRRSSPASPSPGSSSSIAGCVVASGRSGATARAPHIDRAVRGVDRRAHANPVMADLWSSAAAAAASSMRGSSCRAISLLIGIDPLAGLR